MLENTLFYVIFVSQIILLSHYYPKKILGKIRHVITTYPPTEYPKLYPKSIEHYEKFYRNYRLMNQFLFLLGFIILVAILLWEKSTQMQLSPMIPWAYFMIQMFPLMLLEYKEFSSFKQMKKADHRSTRQADLRPRRLLGLISPALLGMAVVMYIAAILFSLYIREFDFHWGSPAFMMIIIITAGNIFFASIAMWHLYGKKIDPYQASEDRIKIIKIALKSMAYVSIGVSIFLIITQGIHDYNLGFLKPGLMSLFCQVMAVVSIGMRLRSLKETDLNFEVYKKDASAI